MVYIDSESKCHATNETGTYTAVETSFFDGKCRDFIEGYLCKISDQDGTQEITPWKDNRELEAAQRAYEQERLAKYEALINELNEEVD